MCLVALFLIAGTAHGKPVAAPQTIAPFGAGALKAEWLTGYNAAEGLDPHGRDRAPTSSRRTRV